MAAEHMKPVTIWNIAGKTIHTVYDANDAWKAHRTSTKVPTKRFLTNFDMKFGKRTVLVLDNYGNDWLNEAIESRLVGADFTGQWLLGIDRESGVFYLVIFYMELGKLRAVLSDLLPDIKMRVPRRYLRYLDNLKFEKRPWWITFQHENWMAFHDREQGWTDFLLGMTVHLRLFNGKQHLQVWGDSYGTVSDWR